MLKRIMILCLTVFSLCGCAAQETFETVADDIVVSAAAEKRTVMLGLPEEAAAPAMESENGAEVYLCNGYELTVEILPAGDMDKTMRTLTGFSADDLTLIRTGDGVTRYDCVWSCQAEEGELIGRAAVLDDGSYHYTLTVLAPAEDAGDLEPVWNEIFSAFSLA